MESLNSLPLSKMNQLSVVSNLESSSMIVALISSPKCDAVEMYGMSGYAKV